jgi:hypothetical protein
MFFGTDSVPFFPNGNLIDSHAQVCLVLFLLILAFSTGRNFNVIPGAGRIHPFNAISLSQVQVLQVFVILYLTQLFSEIVSFWSAVPFPSSFSMSS